MLGSGVSLAPTFIIEPKKSPASLWSGRGLAALELHGLDVPDFIGILTDGAVGGELGTGGYILQALATKGQPVGVSWFARSLASM